MAPQPGPLDGADRPGRADRDDQDPPAAALLYHRTAHPLGTSPHFASAPALALGSPVQWRPGTGCEPFHSQPDDPSATGPPSGQPNVPANSRQSGPLAPLPVSYLAISLITATAGRHRRPQKRLQTARRTSHLPQWSPGYLPCSSLTPSSAVLTPSIGVLRWIRAYIRTSQRKVRNSVRVGPSATWDPMGALMCERPHSPTGRDSNLDAHSKATRKVSDCLPF